MLKQVSGVSQYLAFGERLSRKYFGVEKKRLLYSL
jgi:hypothetical protein